MLSTPSPQSYPSSMGRKKALCIGIQYKANEDLDPVSGAHADAHNFAQVLEGVLPSIAHLENLPYS